MKMVSVIGLGLSTADLTAEHLKIIGSADILIGGKRHLAFFENFSGIKKEIGKNLGEVADFVRQHRADRAIAVLASGDPLFHGIGSYLVKKIGAEHVRIWPNVTSVSAAFARIKQSWQDACIISMHGQLDESQLMEALCRENKIALLTDPQHSPAWLAQFLAKKEITAFRMCVLEQMGTDAEQMQWLDAKEAAEKKFADPNLVILIRKEKMQFSANLHTGMPDDVFAHENGLITKAEVRAVTLSKLRLNSPDLTLWDLGAGSGSVSVEASLFLPKGKIFALEQHPERIAQIRENRKRFGAYQMEVMQTVVPDGLENLPRPDRVFIGGGGKHLESIIRAAAGYMKDNGVMVINTVLLQNMQTALDTLRKIGFTMEIIQMQISAGKAMPWGERLAAQNPVWIVTGNKNDNV